MQEETFMLHCPKCGAEFKVKAHLIVNRVDDPELYKRFLSPEFFSYTCPKCNMEFVSEHSLIYTDPEAKFVMQFLALDSEEDAEGARRECLETIHETREEAKRTGQVEQTPRFRLVTDSRVLREKAMIVAEGLDDRIIEIMKYLMIATVRISHEEMHPTEAFFVKGPDGATIGMLEGEEILGGFDFDPKLYESVKEDYSEVLDPDVDEEIEVDAAWATAFIEHLRSSGK